MNICSNVNGCLYKRYMVYLAWTLCLILMVILSASLYFIGDFIRGKQSYKVCTTDQCLHSAARLKYSMNPNVDPCDNFYEYSCGRWSIDNPERAWFPSLTTFDKAENNISATIQDFFMSMPKKCELKQVEQARILFESCMNEGKIDSLEYTKVFQYLEEAGLPKLPSIFTLKEKHHADFGFDWLRMDTKLKKLFAMDVFIGFGISPDDFNVTKNAIHIGTPQGESPLPQSLHCSSVVTKFMPDVVAYSIVDRSFLNSTETKVHELLDNVREAFLKNVDSSDWLNQEEKEAISKKTKAMMDFIAYPRDLLEERLLEEKYLHLTMRPDAYLENLMGIVRNFTTSNIQKLRRTNNRTWVEENYLDVNAFYSSENNAITIPLGILSFPFYDLGIQALNYGALGSVVGHELTHGFDNEGRKRDKYGNIKRWWSRPTLKSFEQKAKCFVEQYANFTLDEIGSVNGENTLTENIADNGGLHEAFTAYKSYLANNGREDRLPGFEDSTDEQMFFLGFANLWCEKTDPFIMKLSLLLDNHTPPPFRVLGPLQNSKEFAETFSCPLGSKMNPDREKCSVW